MDIQDIIGKTFWEWTVIGHPQKRGKRVYVECRCSCGTVKMVRLDGLPYGSTKSCGCVRLRKTTTHGQTNTRLYAIWGRMKDRCLNPHHVHYANYGGRGISICDQWLNSFESFRDWAMSNGYSDELSLDRKNTNGNYTPDNCRWATALEQQNNTRNNQNITALGKTQSIARWAAETGIPYSTIYSRISNGWERALAVTTPINTQKSRKRCAV